MRELWKSIQKKNARRELQARRADFYFDLALTLEDRVPLFTTLRKYESRARQRAPSTAPLYMDMLRGLRSGSLASALDGISNSSELIMIDALQNVGDASMADGLKFLSQTVEKTDLMAQAARKALIYPISVFLLFSAMLASFSIFVVPTLAEILPPEQWPFIGQALYFVANSVKHYGAYMALFIVALITGFIYSLSRWTSPMRRKLDQFVPYSLYRDYAGAMLIISISSLMRNGISLRSSIERSMKYSSPWMRWHLREILIRLSNPNTVHFGDAFQTGVLSQELEDRVQDASERRNPIEAFVKIGVGSMDRVIQSIERSASRMSSRMLVVCGFMMMFMMAGFFATAMEMQTGIRNNASKTRVAR